MELTPANRERYSRQIYFHGLGEQGQQRLLDACVAIVGCGALGTFHADALARAGVGRLKIIDRDYVELSNLQRQWLFDESDAAAGLPKAAAAAQAIARINSSIAAEPLISDLTPSNIAELLEGANLILDGTDNFETRYLLNDYAISTQTPWIYGAAVGSYGLSMAIIPGHTSCLKCVYPSPPTGAQPTCETAGVLGSITALIASLQTAEAIRYLATGQTSRRITRADLWTGEIRQTHQPPPDPDCQACARRDFVHLNDANRAPISLCGRNAVQIHERHRPIRLPELAARLRPLGPVRVNDFALTFDAGAQQLTIFPDGRMIVKGTTDPGVARSLYARYIGN